jgi:hypothetical protein
MMPSCHPTTPCTSTTSTTTCPKCVRVVVALPHVFVLLFVSLASPHTTQVCCLGLLITTLVPPPPGIPRISGTHAASVV